MARQPRIDFPGAFHHVMNRGADHQTTYYNDRDRTLFLDLWANAVTRFGIEVICFAVMGNHYHVFVRSPEAQLSPTMQYIGRAYTQTFNRRHSRDGALFRGRFHSVLIDSDTYFARVARYVDLNPVAAGVVSMSDLATYRWSSFRLNAARSSAPSWLATGHLAKYFPTGRDYARFVSERAPDSELDHFYSGRMAPGRVLGKQSYVDKVAANHPELSGQISAGIPETTVEEIDSLIVTLARIDRIDLYRPKAGRGSSPARHVAIDLARSLTDEPGATLGRRYGFASRHSFNNAVRAVRRNTRDSAIAELRSAVLQSIAQSA